MRSKFFLLFILGYLISACHGKSCTQDAAESAYIDNQSSQNLTLDVIYIGYGWANYTSTITLAANQSYSPMILRTYTYEKEPTPLKVYGSTNASCSGVQRSSTLIYLQTSSFSLVKNCIDNANYQSIIIDNNASCPSGTILQTAPKS